jgi:Zn-dependent protease with chaperone function
MNFFERQTQTRRLSRQLVVLLLIAVIAVVIAIDFALFTAFASLAPEAEGIQVPTVAWMSAHPGIVGITSLIVVGVIALSSLYKTTVLSGGGGVVARSLGGVRISADTTDAAQRRLLNVVEEMSIAAGVPMPEVYLLEQESGINAFAAGHNAANAAIGVTRGALTKLNRAELQGVIAHEFSHILNGDMRLNVRLMGLLFGLLVVALIARTVLRHAPRGGSGKKGGAVAAVLLVAVVVLIVGYVGLFFARLIQAGVSRSRESLADASAVQFTRDPSGLRGALVKIGASGGGSQISSAEVEEVAHMLFAPGIKRFFATHPELEARLKAIDPRFDKREFAEAQARLDAMPDPAIEAGKARRSAAERLNDVINIPAAVHVSALVGNPGTAHMVAARRIRESLPESLVVASRHPDAARALLLALALEADATARERQLRYIAQQLGVTTANAVKALVADVAVLAAEQRLPMLLALFPALRQLGREERLGLMSCLNGMLQREGRLSLQAYSLRKLAQVHLRDDLEARTRVGSASLKALSKNLQTLFSVIAQHGHGTDVEARRAYEAGMHHVLPRERPAFLPVANWQPSLDVALSHLDQLAPIAKEQLIEGLAKTVVHDQQLTVGEAELLRVVCATLHCPLPPLIEQVSGDPGLRPG